MISLCYGIEKLELLIFGCLLTRPLLELKFEKSNLLLTSTQKVNKVSSVP